MFSSLVRVTGNSSQNEVSETGFTIPLEITKYANKIQETVVFSSLGNRQQGGETGNKWSKNPVVSPHLSVLEVSRPWCRLSPGESSRPPRLRSRAESTRETKAAKVCTAESCKGDCIMERESQGPAEHPLSYSAGYWSAWAGNKTIWKD